MPISQIELVEFESWKTGDIFRDSTLEVSVVVTPASEEDSNTSQGCGRPLCLRERKRILKQFHFLWVMMTSGTDLFSFSLSLFFFSLFSLTKALRCRLPLSESLLW